MCRPSLGGPRAHVPGRAPRISSWKSVDSALKLGDDLDPSLVHRPEPLSLLPRILVRDGADHSAASRTGAGRDHNSPAKIGGSTRSMLSDQVMWVKIGASMPPEARRSSPTTVPRRAAANTNTGLPPATVANA